MKASYLNARASLLCVGGIAVITSSSFALAGNWELSVQPRLDIGVASYSLDFGAVAQVLPGGGSDATSKLSFSDTMPTAGIGLTVFADRLFVDLSAQTFFNGEISDSNTFSIAAPGSLAIGRGSYEADDVNRDEIALAVGYGIAEDVAVYAGYKWARVSADELGGVAPTEIYLADGSAVSAAIYTAADYEFEYDGPFIGATVGWEVKDRLLQGRLSLNVAVALLSGELTAKSGVSLVRFENGQTQPSTSPSELYDTTGESVGILLGVSWVGHTGVDGLSYTIGVNGYSYDFDADDQGKADINESVVQFKLGLAYVF